MKSFGNDNFRDVRIERADLFLIRGYDAMEYRCNWCGGPAFFIVERTSTLSGNKYADYACSPCAQKWVRPTREQLARRHSHYMRNLPAGLKEQRRERLSDSRVALCATLTPEERRIMTSEARKERQRRRNIECQK